MNSTYENTLDTLGAKHWSGPMEVGSIIPLESEMPTRDPKTDDCRAMICKGPDMASTDRHMTFSVNKGNVSILKHFADRYEFADWADELGKTLTSEEMPDVVLIFIGFTDEYLMTIDADIREKYSILETEIIDMTPLWNNVNKSVKQRKNKSRKRRSR